MSGGFTYPSAGTIWITRKRCSPCGSPVTMPAGKRMPFLIDFEGGFRPNLDVITEGSIVRNGIIGDFRFLVHPVAHLHGDGVRQKLHIVLSQECFQSGPLLLDLRGGGGIPKEKEADGKNQHNEREYGQEHGRRLIAPVVLFHLRSLHCWQWVSKV